jgi:RNA polymerase sigma-70 factor (ECF subfamily)
MRSIDGSAVEAAFQDLQRAAETLARFAGPLSVVEYLAHEGGDLDEKDRILAALVEGARLGGARRLAQSLLLLCLWPGLDAIFRRRLHLFIDRPHDLGGELIDRFAGQVRRIDLRGVTRLAATLVRNTEREVVEARMRELTDAARTGVLSPNVVGEASPDEGTSPFGVARGQSDDVAIAALRAWLERAIGRDAELVVDAIIHKRGRRELAAARGISEVALRKRLERALARARRALDVDSESHIGAVPAFGAP